MQARDFHKHYSFLSFRHVRMRRRKLYNEAERGLAYNELDRVKLNQNEKELVKNYVTIYDLLGRERFKRLIGTRVFWLESVEVPSREPEPPNPCPLPDTWKIPMKVKLVNVCVS